MTLVSLLANHKLENLPCFAPLPPIPFSEFEFRRAAAYVLNNLGIGVLT
jgi:hypothetical protein